MDGQDAVEDGAEMEGKRACHVTRDSISVRRMKEVAGKDVGSPDLSFIAQTFPIFVGYFSQWISKIIRPQQKSNIVYNYQSCTCILYVTVSIRPEILLKDEGDFPDYKTGGSPL